ncbi:MAG TPA: PepSY-associated TM helix domain-containing protein [Terriglobia bacterium]|nr:PepSY-associated TM helix domain-containing protein [Terriglobia bacterium]
MASWQQWLRQPQTVWLRKALFQIHLWSGIGIGIYVVLISISGSILVYRNELFKAFTAKPIIVEASGPRMTQDQLKAAALKAYPDYDVSQYFEKKKVPREAVEMWLEQKVGSGKVQRLFNPYTGADLGNSVPNGIRLMSWMTDLHLNLLTGDTGRYVNAAGAVLWTALGLTGCIVWWPGIQNWKRSLGLRLKVGWKRFNWDLHSAMGIWTSAFVLMWGITGIYASLPAPFRAIVDYFDPPNDEFYGLRSGDRFLRFVSRLHFGTFAGRSMATPPIKIIWCVVGLAPVVLFITGVIMWWNRVLRKSEKTT